MFNWIERTVLPKETVEHADKEFLCFLRLLKGNNSLSKEVRKVHWKEGAFGIHQARFCSLHLSLLQLWTSIGKLCCGWGPGIPTQPLYARRGTVLSISRYYKQEACSNTGILVGKTIQSNVELRGTLQSDYLRVNDTEDEECLPIWDSSPDCRTKIT